MATYDDVLELLRTWDDIIGEQLYGEDGVETADDYWYPLAFHVVRASIGGTGDDEVQAAALCASLASLDLLDAEAWDRNRRGHADNRELAIAVAKRHGLGSRTANRVADRLEHVAGHWTSGVGDNVRKLVRTAAHEMITSLAPKLIPDASGLAAETIAAAWGEATLGLQTRWSRGAEEFAERFGLSFGDLYRLSDDLDRAFPRIDGVASGFMDLFCAACEPTQHQACVNAASDMGVKINCPLRND